MSGSRRTQASPFTIRGRWWLPGDSTKVAGDLVYDEDDIKLRLYGALAGAAATGPFSVAPEPNEFPVIHGESLDTNTEFTLFRSFYLTWRPDASWPLPDAGSTVVLSESSLHCRLLIEGMHLPHEGELFSSCSVEIPALETWLCDKPFKTALGSSLNEVSLQYVRPPAEVFELLGAQLTIRLVRLVTPPPAPTFDPSIRHQAIVEIQPLAPKPASWFCSRASDVVELLSLLYGGILMSRRITLHASPRYAEFPVFYLRHQVTVPANQTNDILCRFPNLSSHFGQMLEKWFSAAADEKRSRRMLVSSERRPSTFIELRFLPLVHAAEVLAKNAEYSTIVDKQSFDELRTRMLHAIPFPKNQELIDSISNSLGWANGRTLKRKLQHMLNDLGSETCTLFCVDSTAFVNGLVNTRNYYTHYTSGVRVLQAEELHWAIRKLSLMIRIALLRRTGLPESELLACIRSHLGLRQERAVWSRISEEGSKIVEDDDY